MITPPVRFLKRRYFRLTTAGAALLVSATVSFGEIETATGHDPDGQLGFRLPGIPAPSSNDLATTAKFTLLDGQADGNGGSLEQLHDGKLPNDADEPAQNFFFAPNTSIGRILVDLNRVAEIKQVNTYSWHPSTRGPQVYQLYASDGGGEGFNARPKGSADLETSGWKLVAQVDTRSKGGGQHGVSISDADGIIGKYRYLLFAIARAENGGAFGNTFYSELDVIEQNAPVAPVAAASPAAPFALMSADGYCEITIDTAGAPDLKEWAEQKLAPVLADWYPKIVAMLPSEGWKAPKQFSVSIRPGDGVAATSGTRITANSIWLQGELNREAIGALVHEMVHVVQQYGRARPNGSAAKRAPGWLVEGITDYLRFFKFEPQSHGADRTWLQANRNQTLNYDGSYRVSANFLDYIVEKYDQEKTLIAKVNAACREGKYTDALWKELTGKSLAELNDEWKAAAKN